MHAFAYTSVSNTYPRPHTSCLEWILDNEMQWWKCNDIHISVYWSDHFIFEISSTHVHIHIRMQFALRGKEKKRFVWGLPIWLCTSFNASMRFNQLPYLSHWYDLSRGEAWWLNWISTHITVQSPVQRKLYILTMQLGKKAHRT